MDGACLHWLLRSADTVKFSFTGIILPKEHKVHWVMILLICSTEIWSYMQMPRSEKLTCMGSQKYLVWHQSTSSLDPHSTWHASNQWLEKGEDKNARFQKGLRDRPKKLKLYYGPKIYLLIEDLQDKKNWKYHFPKPPQVCHSCLHSPITWVPSASISWCR